jgi:alkylmercury lyase
MKTNGLPELAARITAPMRTTGGKAFLEIIPPTLALLARSKPASPEEIAAASAKSPEEVRAALDRFPSAEWDEQGRVVGLGLTLQLTPIAWKWRAVPCLPGARWTPYSSPFS